MDTENPVAGAPPLADVVQSIATTKGWRPTNWSDHCVSLLREHHAQGISSSESARLINERYGTNHTRNAVIGKRNRLGLVGGAGDPTRSAPVRATRAEKRSPRGKPHQAKPQPPKPQFKQEASGMRSVATTGFRHLDLLELKAGECKWPSSGDGPFTFCGCAVFNNINALPYCAPHYALATRPSVERKHISTFRDTPR